ncbi:MAG: helix-turn-helix transcriptional regulator [Ancrocorticia sp.]
MYENLEVSREHMEMLIEHAAHLVEADNDMRWALIQARKQAGLSQLDLAELMGVKQPTVAKFEREDNDPRLSTLRRYALAVGATIAHQVTSSDGKQFNSVNWSE